MIQSANRNRFIESEGYEDWYELLTCSIIRQAVEDFRRYVRLLEKSTMPSSIKNYKKELKDIVIFFNSRWFETISKVHRDMLCRQLIKELKQFLVRHKNQEKFLKELILEMEGL